MPVIETQHKLITSDTLREWRACSDGYKRFCELFPEGATLAVASAGLIADGHKNWSDWLWSACKNDNEYANQTIVSAGRGGTASAGRGGTASAGRGGTASAGAFGTASAGAFGTASAGDWGTASAGDWGTASAGAFGTASAGDWGTASAGDGGVITILHFSERRFCRQCAEVGGKNGLKPNTPYKLDANGNFIEAEAQHAHA